MPKIVRKTSGANRIGVYGGPTPNPGVYPAVVRSVSLVTFDSGTQALNTQVEFEAPHDDERAKFNGYKQWGRLFLGEHEMQIERENAFYRAICGKEDVDVLYDDRSERRNPPITKIGGVNPVGKKVLVDLALGNEYQGERRLEVRAIYPLVQHDEPPASAIPVAPADPDADLISAGGDSEEEKVEVSAAPVANDISAPDVDYHSLPVWLLKAYAAERGVNSKQPKAKILAELDAKFAPGGDDGLGEFAPKTSADLERATEGQVKAFAETLYEPSDLEGMDKQAFIDFLVDEGVVTSF